MALHSNSDFNGEETLESLMQDIYEHLQKMGARRFNRWRSPRTLDDLYGSWTTVNVELCLFVRDPKHRYQKMMHCLEQHKLRARQDAEYAKKLDELARFISRGPQFSSKYDCKLLTLKKKLNK